MLRIRAPLIGLPLVVILAAVVYAPRAARGQSLDQMRHDIRDGTTDSSKDSKSKSSSDERKDDSSCNDDDGVTLDGDACKFIFGVVTAPYWLPFNIIGDDYNVHAYFLRYPYWHEFPGAMFTTLPNGPRERTVQAEFGFEYSDSFEDLARLGGHFRLSTTSRFDIETNWNTLWEKTGAGNDSVGIGDVDLLYRFAQSERLQLRSGLGANWFDDHQGIVGGFNFRYGADYFPSRPWHLTALMDLGEIGKAGLVHFRTTAGVMYARWEIYTGYDYRKIGSVEFDGPVAGVQFRF